MPALLIGLTVALFVLIRSHAMPLHQALVVALFGFLLGQTRASDELLDSITQGLTTLTELITRGGG